MGQLVKVANTGDVPEGHGIVVEAAGHDVALFHVDGKYFAIDGTCTHKGGPLAEGELNGNVVTCPWHGWKFNVATGEAVFNEQIKVQTYEVKVEGEDITVELES
ncbi:MAG: non-heme iron oxygenase ferredoxin subunit [Acidobacteria bacterium]|nr:non-heme iron oxygenase ferredoxin subunit [Acidobacteriota bacterium]